jgi:hypothetical protein
MSDSITSALTEASESSNNISNDNYRIIIIAIAIILFSIFFYREYIKLRKKK